MTSRTARRNLDAVERAAHAFDQAAWSPASLGRAWSLSIRRRREKEAAERSPIWKREEEARRHADGTYTMCSDTLTFCAWVEHEEHLDALAPEPKVQSLAAALSSAQLAPLARKAKDAYDRLTRGWTDSDLWNLGTAGAHTIGERLIALSETVTGWPDSQYPTWQEWADALKSNGHALIDYADGKGLDELRAAWWETRDDPAAQEKADTALREREEELLHEAQRALRWVADMLPHLWD